MKFIVLNRAITTLNKGAELFVTNLQLSVRLLKNVEHIRKALSPHLQRLELDTELKAYEDKQMKLFQRIREEKIDPSKAKALLEDLQNENLEVVKRQNDVADTDVEFSVCKIDASLLPTHVDTEDKLLVQQLLHTLMHLDILEGI